MIRVLAGIARLLRVSAFFARHQAVDPSTVPAGIVARPRSMALRGRVAAMAALAAGVLMLSATAGATTYTVNLFDTNSDAAANGPNVGDGLGAGVGSGTSGDLRWAILQANAAGGANIIQSIVRRRRAPSRSAALCLRSLPWLHPQWRHRRLRPDHRRRGVRHHHHRRRNKIPRLLLWIMSRWSAGQYADPERQRYRRGGWQRNWRRRRRRWVCGLDCL